MGSADGGNSGRFSQGSAHCKEADCLKDRSLTSRGRTKTSATSSARPYRHSVRRSLSAIGVHPRWQIASRHPMPIRLWITRMVALNYCGGRALGSILAPKALLLEG